MSKHFHHYGAFLSDAQRPGIADGGEIEFRPPETAVWLFDKIKYYELKLGFIR